MRDDYSYRDVGPRSRRYRGWDDDNFDRRRSEPRSATKGIISFVLALLLGVGTVGLFFVVGVVEAMSPGTFANNSPATAILGLVMLASMAGMLIGVVLGIFSLLASESMKIFAILGMIFNALMLLGLLGLVVVGAIMG